MNSEEIYGFARSIHERAERIIEQEIFCCDSSFISDLMNESAEYPTALLLQFTIEDIENYFDVSPESVQGFLESCPEFDEIENEYFSPQQKLDFAESHGFEAEPREIYEYWRVSDYLALKLIEAKEPVLSNSYGYWWGRTCTGQSIILDGTIQRIIA